MTAYRIAYAAFFAAALAFSQVYAGHLSSVTLITVLALPFFSLIIAVIERFALKLVFDCASVTVERGTEVRVQLTVKNRFVFPCSSIFITASMPDIEDKREAKLIFSLGILQTKQLNFLYPSNFRGEFEISVNNAYMYDILKIFKLKKSFNYKKSVLVVPKIYNTVGGGDCGLTTEQETVLQTSDFSGGERSFVRKYSNGDDIRKIHWKLSSKQEDYMVWTDVKNRFQNAVVFCDVSEYSDNKVENAKGIDAVLEIGLAACLYNIKQGRECIFAYYSKKYEQTRRILITSMEEFYTAAVTAASIKSYTGEPSLELEAKKLFNQNENSPATLLITCDNSENLVWLSKEISAYSEFSLILAGKAEAAVENGIQALKKVRFASADCNITQEKISEMLSQIY